MAEPTRPRCYVSGALIDGWAAWSIARLLTRHCREQIEELPSHLREPVEDALAALTFAGERWAGTSAMGSGGKWPAEAAISSMHEDELTTSEAADVLHVTARRVRQLAADGRLPGHQRQGRWTLDRGSVIEYQHRKGRAA